MLANINKIIEVNPFCITAEFNEGELRMIDLTAMINQYEKGTIAQLKDLQIFSAVKCDGTTIFWDNLLPFTDFDGTVKLGPLDLDPNVMYDLSKPIN